jgi:serine-type D-Ala-D-Ala carboxypeptidase (penicillin-binding protein 5/6)
MSTSPLLEPSHRHRRRREAVRYRRRRRRRWLVAGALALALAILLAALVAGQSGSKHGSSAAGARHTSRSPAAAPRPALSPLGLTLGKPPLTLAFPARGNPVRLPFRRPPRAGLLFDLDSGRVLWQRNPYRRLRIASLTKMMTALLTVQSAAPSAHVQITKQAIETAGSKVGVLPPGGWVRLETMLYGLMLPSGNDAAIALAQRVGGSVSGFVTQMNAEAAKLGLGCTRYSSPSGYYDEGNFSCAADLAVLAHVDLQQPRIARVARTFRAVLPFPTAGGKIYLYNNNPLLRYGYPGATGLKTGYTLAAGDCLVATAQRGGVRLGVVLLHSPALATQARQLLDQGFESVYRLPPVREPPMPPGA